MNIIDNQDTITKVKDTLVKQVLGYGGTYYYSVITFGFLDKYGIPLPPSIIHKYWDKTEVEKTCRIIYRSLKETFNIENIFMFIERHKPMLDKDGDIIKEGRFHLNIITTGIDDHIIECPNRKVRKLLLENGDLGIPIQNIQYKDIEDIKIDLFNVCCKRFQWLNNYNSTIETQPLPTEKDVENVVYYCLGDWTGKYKDKKGNPTRNIIDFTDIIVWKSSDFYSE